ncbi:MAG TPA: cytochrome c maturation protein CcmE [Myxococcota bacterium]|nr:cytochrome c maturation protein CcmE [Myxococcota bacterium]
MSANKQGPLFLVGALFVAASALSLVWFAADQMGENLTYYWEPAQVAAAGDEAIGPTIRLGGIVKEGSLDWRVEEQELWLVVGDDTAEVKVHAKGAPPQMLREGIGVVVEGTMTPVGVFEADRLLVKHSNEYKAPFEGMSEEERQALYETIEEDI